MAQHGTQSNTDDAVITRVPENKWSIFLLKARGSVSSDLLM